MTETRLVRPTHSFDDGADPSPSKRRAYMAYFAVVLVGVWGLGRALPLLDPGIATVADVVLPPTLAFFASRHAAVASIAVWIPIVVVWAFIVFSSRAGPLASIGFLAAAAAVVAVHPLGGGALGAAGTVFAVQLVVASGIFVVLLYALSRQLERQTAIRLAAEYAAGDVVLRELARRIDDAVRGADTVARLGGDEFVVLSFVDAAAGSESIADRLVAVSEEPLRINGMEIAVGVSVGVGVSPDDGTDIETLLASSDGAMYAAKARAKARGKGRGKGRRALASEATPIPASRPEPAPVVPGYATR